MTILNRRNAMLGWAAWKLGKRALKRKARGALPGGAGGSRRGKAPALLSAAAAIAYGLWRWRRSRPDSDSPT